MKAEHEDGEAGNNTDGDGIDIDGVVAHMPEDDMGAVDGMNDGEETGPSQDDIGGTTSSVSAPSTAIPQSAFLSEGASLTPSPVLREERVK